MRRKLTIRMGRKIASSFMAYGSGISTSASLAPYNDRLGPVHLAALASALA
jgi:hypothetical protein